MNHKSVLSFTIPGQSPGVTGSELPVPSGIPAELRGGLPDAGTRIFQLAFNSLLLVGVTLAVIVLILSGIQWITSGGDPAKIRAAKTRIFYALLGLVIASAAFLIIRIVITVLGGDPTKFFNPASFLQ